MADKQAIWEKIFLGFGVVTVMSGIYLVIQKDHVIGISGTMVGALLVYQNLRSLREHKE